MPTPVILLILATLLPLGSFAALLFVGKRMGGPLAGWLGTGVIGGSFLCSVAAMASWYQGGHYFGGDWGKDRGPVLLNIQWLPVGTGADQTGLSDHPSSLDAGIYVDSLTIAMFSMVTLAAALVHVFGVGSMIDDPHAPRFFTWLAFVCFAMMGLVLAGTLVQLFVFWELTALASCLLIGFWRSRPAAAHAATVTFIAGRIGDAGFLVGIGILFCHLGNLTLPHLWMAIGSAGQGSAVPLAGGAPFSGPLLSAAGIGLFISAAVRSAQFPLHALAADAVEAPPAANALLMTAAPAAAGIYLVGRVFPILTPDARLFIAIIGLTTLVTGALIALVQSDINRVLAFSTVSQLGLMMLGIGIGSWVGGLFHLITHAFSKSLLFLAAGSVMSAADHGREMPRLGGLARRLPVTAAAFAVGVLSLAGTPGFGGSYSNQTILAHAGAFATLAHRSGRSGGYALFLILPAAMAYFTPLYLTRCWMLIFAPRPRPAARYDSARERPLMWVPLMLLAGASIISGKWLGVPELLKSSIKETQSICQTLQTRHPFYRDRDFAGFTQSWTARLPWESADQSADAPAPSDTALFEAGERLAARYTRWAFLIGILTAAAFYARGDMAAGALLRVPPFAWIYRWLYRGMYFKELYSSVFVATTMAFAALADWFDRVAVDGSVNLLARAVRKTATAVAFTDRCILDGALDGMAVLALHAGVLAGAPRTGRMRIYVAVLLVILGAGAAAAIVAVLCR